MSGKSPAQMFCGHLLRGKLPHLPGANDLDIANAKAGADLRKKLMEQRENQPGTSLKQLSVNQNVPVQNPITKSWDEKGIVTGICPLGRSNDVLMDSGKTFLRNRSFLRPILGAPTEQSSTSPVKPLMSHNLLNFAIQPVSPTQNSESSCQATCFPVGGVVG